ncbi:MAG: biotin--[acetyl-CoA-carboxylase] ligase [Bacteroidota bacterium]|nr:biotin--[acetyl-CoA-carboxylase] ligase [Bacteroidota bacterium]
MQLLRSYSSLDSTNSEAHRLLGNNEAYHGLAILAFKQTEGRGQHGRAWHSEPGQHLAMSIIIKPNDMSPSELPVLSMKVSLGIVRVINKIDATIQPKIKWPNDIYVNGKKLAGILIENNLSSHKVQHCIIGIGMNVNEQKFEDSLQNAISIRMLTNESSDIVDIASAIRHEVLTRLDITDMSWKKEYHQYIFSLGEERSFENNVMLVKGQVVDVDDQGRLCIQLEDGSIQAFYSHELRWIL